MRFSLLLFFIALHLTASSQLLTGEVLDSITKQKLPYANLSFKNKMIGSYTNDNGFYTLDISKALLTDTIIASYIGYEPKELALREFIEKKESSLTIELMKKADFLDEVVITNNNIEYSKNTSSLASGKRKTVFPSSVPFGYENATLIENPAKRKGKIIEINLKFKTISKENQNTYQTYYRLSFYSINDLGFPEQLLDYEDILIKPEIDDKSYSINVENSNIAFSENGFFIGIETVKPDFVKTSSSPYLTAPSILFTHSTSNLLFKRFGSNKWYKLNRKSVFRKNHYTVPFLKVKVAYLKD